MISTFLEPLLSWLGIDLLCLIGLIIIGVLIFKR